MSANWNTEGYTAKAIKAIEDGFAEANRHVLESGKSLMRGARKLGVLHSHHFRGDKARFTEAAEALFCLGASQAYEYVQAADAEKVFGAVVRDAAPDAVDGIGVRTWAKLDRFTGSEEKVEEGKAIIVAEVARATKAKGQPFTNAGLTETLRSASGKTPSPASDRRIGRIADKYADSLRTSFDVFLAKAEKSGMKAAYYQAIRIGIAWASADGAATDLALTQMASAWEQEIREAHAAQAAKDAADAAYAEKVKGEAPTPKPAPTVKGKRVAPRRSAMTEQVKAAAAKKAAAKK